VLKKITVNTVLYAAGPQLPRVVGFLLLPIFTRHLTSTDYGYAGLIYSYTGLLAGLADLGIYVRLANIYFKSPGKWQNPWQQLFGFSMLWSLIFGVIQAAILFLLLPDSMGANKLLIIGLLTISSVFFTTVTNYCYKILQFKELAKFITTVNVVVGALAIALNYYSIVVLQIGYVGWFVSGFVVACLQGLLCGYYLFSREKILPNFRLRKSYIVKTLRITLPMVPHSYASYLLDSSDRFLLARMGVPISTIGRYNFGYIFANYFDVFVSSLGIAISPSMYKVYFSKAENRHWGLKVLNEAVFVLGLFLVFNIALWLKEFLQVFISNQELKAVYPIAIIVLVGYCYKPIYWYSNAILTYNNQTSSLWKITFVAAVVNIILNLILIPHFSIYAAAASTFVSFILIAYLGFRVKAFRKFNKAKINEWSWIMPLLILLVCSMLLMDANLWIKLIAFIVGNIFFGILLYRYYLKIRTISATG
jgi:O-antigen/teichoic acid export membrane protein